MPWHRVMGSVAMLLANSVLVSAPPTPQQPVATSAAAGCKRPLQLGSNRIEGRISGGTSFVVEAVVDRFIDNCGGAAFDGDSWWGASMQPPKLVLRDLVLSVDAVREVLPRSAYTYLAEPRCLQVERSDGRVKLVLKGADAGDAYSAEFEFRSGRLVKRIVRSQEFPQEIYETTEYVNKAAP
jgi:hypothetical protein